MTEREMKQRKAAARQVRQRKARNRRVLTTVALMLIVCIASIGGTIAWLTDQTGVVTNTFSPSNIDIWMTETVNGELKDTKNDESIANNTFKIVPGTTESKDPKVVVKAGSEDAWLFVQVKENGGVVTVGETTTGFSNFITYSVDTNNWTKYPDVDNIYYCKYGARNDTDISVKVLEGETVSYPTTITKEMMDALGTNAPTLTFKAAAVQQANMALEDAYAEVKGFFADN